MKLIIASNNKNKIREIKEILGSHFEEIISMQEAGINLEVVEDGTTFCENAMKKANETLKLVADDCATLADDSGLEVDCLLGAPGIYSARYAGEGHDDEANNKKLIENLSGVPMEQRSAHYTCAMVLSRHGMDTISGIGRCDGKIIDTPRGTGGFGYDPYFLSDDFPGKTFSELTPDEKNSVSHRKRALSVICDLLEKEKR